MQCLLPSQNNESNKGNKNTFINLKKLCTKLTEKQTQTVSGLIHMCYRFQNWQRKCIFTVMALCLDVWQKFYSSFFLWNLNLWFPPGLFFGWLQSAEFVPVLKSQCHVQSCQGSFQTIPDNGCSLCICSCGSACTLIRARSCVSALLVFVMVTVCFFAGSQQSQDQTSRRSGNTGEKHNENGVRISIR